jgi:cyclic pyranopterin monophosphate synthase
LTLYDLLKAIQRDVVVTDLRLRRKTGGRSGDVDLP